MKKIIFVFATLALAAASAAEKHTLQLYTSAVIGGQELKAGEYKMVVTDNKIAIKDGKRLIEADVKVENEAKKFQSSAVRYTADKQVTEIRIGGTTTKLLLGSGASNAN